MKNTIVFKDKVIEYEVIKAKIKNLYIHIKEGKVIVKAPARAKYKDIERAVEEKKKWIYEKLENMHIDKYKQGSKVFLLGRAYLLKIKFMKQNESNIYIENGNMIVEIPKKNKRQYEKEIEELLDDVYMKVAEKEVDMAMQIVTRIVGIKPNKYRIKKLKTAWGTCTSNKNITINSTLMKYDRTVIQYVVLHEICHLKYMNHSKEFWNMVEQYMENYKDIRRKLKE
ncbi:MAG: M48 family metallopeptidase [Clostridia bacterium]|nr:M48 family metallopeptidase [Clostridia bacterium]